MIGIGYNDILSQNDLFSRGSFLCHRAQLALECLSQAPDDEEGCPTMYEIGHCWTGVKPKENLTTSCPRLDPLVSPSKDRSINRYCYPEEPSILANGTIETDEFGNPVMWPMGWMDIPEILIDIQNCNKITADKSADMIGNMTTNAIDEPYQEYFQSWNLSRDICLVLSFMSFIATFVSLVLMMLCLKKCTRIYIHMNLLLAFMFRTLLFIWSQVTMAFSKKTENIYPYLQNLTENLNNYEFAQYTKANISLVQQDIDDYCVEHFRKEHLMILSCRTYPVLFQYIIISTYSWMCCEGLYLILLQSRPMAISSSNGSKLSPLRIFNFISWVVPGIIVGIWVGLMLARPDSKFKCFDLNEYVLIVEGPIHFLIVVSALIFMRLIRDLCSKLRAPVHINGGGNFHKRMTKATISLIPLLGIQTGILPLFQERYGFPTVVVNMVLPLMIFLSSSQGLVVSVLYCFTSQEVKHAIVRRWYMHWEVMRINREIISRRQSRDSGLLANLHDRLVNSNHNHNIWSSSQSSKQDHIVTSYEASKRLEQRTFRPSFDHGFCTDNVLEESIEPSVPEHRHSQTSNESVSAGYHSGERGSAESSNQTIVVPSFLPPPPPPAVTEDSDNEDVTVQLRIDED